VLAHARGATSALVRAAAAASLVVLGRDDDTLFAVLREGMNAANRAVPPFQPSNPDKDLVDIAWPIVLLCIASLIVWLLLLVRDRDFLPTTSVGLGFLVVVFPLLAGGILVIRRSDRGGR
jgi:hypothetical protein